ncbi:MAG: glutathione S-transferase N-terminal domain-containing protein [Afipia sp.]|nr:glutathione S-transferase N-terminal domain-containing protein [Afipia sp.]
MAIQLYDLAGKDPAIMFGPFAWRVRMALLHKGLDFEVRPWRFAERETSSVKSVPILIDGDVTISDSLQIVRYLDEAYPDRPRLIEGSVGEANVSLVQALCGTNVFPACISIAVLPVLGILDEPSRDYFRASREAMFGATLEEVNAPDAETGRANLAKGLKPFDEALKNVRFLGGNQMSYADCALFGVLKWADIAGKYRSIDEGSHVGQWFTTLESMFNGYAAKAPRFREVGAYA